MPPNDLTHHITQAVETAGAGRIGHGVDLAFEHNEPALLATMRRRHVAVEINLTSNDQVLGVARCRTSVPGLSRRRRAGGAVDAGLERTDITNEYVRAARDYGFGYADLKALARASLTYSFLDPTDKNDELSRFDDASAAFERAVMARGTVRKISLSSSRPFPLGGDWRASLAVLGAPHTSFVPAEAGIQSLPNGTGSPLSRGRTENARALRLRIPPDVPV